MLEFKLISKTLELQKCEIELFSKSFELQKVKIKCDAYKQHATDMAEQSLIKKYHIIPLAVPLEGITHLSKSQLQNSIPKKWDKEMLGDGIAKISLYSASVKYNTIITFTLLLLLLFRYVDIK